MDKIKNWVKTSKWPYFLEILKWIAIDVRRRIKYRQAIHLYGIWCFVGIYGGGKTMSLVHYLEEMRKKYKDKIYIATNFYYKGEDFQITNWRDLIPERDRPTIFAYDELQNEFNSRNYRDFPETLMSILTQNRKGNGKQIVYTAQDYETVDKNFRRLTTAVVLCKTRLNRITNTRHYTRANFENLITTTSIKNKMKIWPYKKEKFVQTDYERSLFDSYKMLDSAKTKEYLDRIERIDRS